MPEITEQMRAQLRQDFLYMQIKNLPPLYRTLAQINQAYHFSFPEGTFCIFVLSATSKVSKIFTKYEWMLSAEKYIQETLTDVDGDYETLIQGPKLYCLIGSNLPREAITKKLYHMFNGLMGLRNTYTCAWTIGLGRYVSSFTDLPETLSSAQHAIRYSIRDGVEKFYDGNTDCVIYEGGLTILTSSEQVFLKRQIQNPNLESIAHGTSILFRNKQEQIRKYPVYAYMLSLQILGCTIQTLRELMPVDRKTYELFLQYESGIDDLSTLDALIEHTTFGVNQLCQRYQLYLSSGKSQPLWLTVTYIQEHYKEHITLEELSRVADRNPQYISAVFSKACGMSLKEYITSLRMEEAKKLLRSTSIPISEVALKSGYQDTKYFSRTFMKSTGTSPREYRNAQD